MKNCKRRTIFSWIFAFVLLIPMFSIAIRCLYVTFNKNAYQSYSQYNVDTIVNINSNNFNNETLYTLKYVNPSTFNSSITPFTYMSITADDLGISQVNRDSLTKYYFRTNNEIWLANEDNTYIVKRSLTLDIFKSFTFIGNSAQNFFSVFNVSYIVTTDGTLDNVFEYSISQFVDKHGNGLINFFGLLQDYFMQSTTANALYFTFANWCLNYVLLVSCVWLLFSVLMWFINYCNYMLNTSFRKGHGD